MNGKRVFALALSAALAAALVLPAQAVGEVVGHIYHTDIVAKIDGRPIPSYNIGGQTAVMVEDLKEYGFDVVWYGPKRSLTVERVPGKEMTRDYQPEDRTQPVGAVAGDILATDIVAYVQGELVPSFNIQGHTALLLSALSSSGTLSWDGESRTAEVTLASDLALALDGMTAELEAWKAEGGTYSKYTLYPGTQGTLFVGEYTGTAHGDACRMTYVKKNGVRTDLTALLPAHGFGPAYYLAPRDIQISEDGRQLTFFTPVKSEENGETVEWGDTYCVVDLEQGGLRRLDRMDQGLKGWESSVISDHEHQDAEIEVTFTRDYEKVTGEVRKMCCGWTLCSASSSGVSFSFYGNNCGTRCEYCDAGETSGMDTSWVYDAPSVAEENFVQENSPELREKLAQHFRVTWNGQSVTGDLWRSQGNGHVDYNFTFDQPVSLADGDVLWVWMK